MGAESTRKDRLKKLQDTHTKRENFSNQKVSDIFAENVFTLETARHYLSEEIHKELKIATLERGHKISRDVAEQVANALKIWAVSKGVTHFTHWFQPLSGLTAEKHDSLLSLDHKTSKTIEKLEGSSLIQQEPDASSLPSGGLRSTFEARGYTAWDPSSPAFVIQESRVLCIPSVFISYKGQSLDYKTPLLKSCDALNLAAVSVCKLFDKNVNAVTSTLGPEQEYFLVDKGLAMSRPDLLLTGRSLLGSPPVKGQQLEDHYFGAISGRVYDFIHDFETEAYRLGIPIKTRHNEVAPGQFECAPIFEETSLAVDHNLLLMNIMSRIADKYHLSVFFHEKPFKDLNGSGKHNNWSMATNTGINLLSPGKNPENNLLFLTFFINVIKAVHEHSLLLHASIASAGNEHRLGGFEAPPSIISIFIGDFLSKLLQDIEKGASSKQRKSNTPAVDIFKNIPEILYDNTDRNRTSPFAFTGNKFEYRSVGSSANCAKAMIALNAMVAKTLNQFLSEVNARIAQGKKKEEVILNLLKDYIKNNKNILFEGDGYSKEWEKEAEKRKLPNIKSAPKAWQALKSKEAKDVYVKQGIFSEEELEARYEIEIDQYVKKIHIEARLLFEMLQTIVIPSSLSYQKKLAKNVLQLEKLGLAKKDIAPQKKLLEKLIALNNDILLEMETIKSKKDSFDSEKDIQKVAKLYSENLKPLLAELRRKADELETLVDDDLWRLPKYRELLSLR